MTIEDLETSEVLSWREDRLVRMGFEPERAYEVARTTPHRATVRGWIDGSLG